MLRVSFRSTSQRRGRACVGAHCIAKARLNDMRNPYWKRLFQVKENLIFIILLVRIFWSHSLRYCFRRDVASTLALGPSLRSEKETPGKRHVTRKKARRRWQKQKKANQQERSTEDHRLELIELWEQKSSDKFGYSGTFAITVLYHTLQKVIKCAGITCITCITCSRFQTTSH